MVVGVRKARIAASKGPTAWLCVRVLTLERNRAEWAEPSSRFMLDRKAAQERSSSMHGFERACAHAGTETSTGVTQ